jgi:hypothetical protein
VERLPGQAGDPLLVAGHGLAALLACSRVPANELARLVPGHQAAPVRRPRDGQHPVEMALGTRGAIETDIFFKFLPKEASLRRSNINANRILLTWLRQF